MKTKRKLGISSIEINRPAKRQREKMIKGMTALVLPSAGKMLLNKIPSDSEHRDPSKTKMLNWMTCLLEVWFKFARKWIRLQTRETSNKLGMDPAKVLARKKLDIEYWPSVNSFFSTPMPLFKLEAAACRFAIELYIITKKRQPFLFYIPALS